MNPEEDRKYCKYCGDPITTQREIDFGLCDDCFNEAKADADRNNPYWADRELE